MQPDKGTTSYTIPYLIPRSYIMLNTLFCVLMGLHFHVFGGKPLFRISLRR
jgi:hypothetical protein